MKKRYFALLLMILALLVTSGTRSTVSAAPTQQSNNLLNNASFEQPYVNGTAEGWSAWHMETEKTDEECLSGYHYKPKWNIETGGANVNNGVAAQYIGNNWDTWGGGVYQTVDVTPGTTYRFSFFAKGRASNDPSPEPSEFGINMNTRAGIDPNGTGQWYDGDVVWGPSSSPHDSWQQFSVEATATGDKMTVFTYADLGVPGVNQCRQYLDTWYDNAELVVVAQAAPPTAPPAPTNPPAPQPTATIAASPTEELQPTQEPQPTPETPPEAPTTGATICANAFNDVNANGIHDPNEPYMAEVTFTVANENAIIGAVISDGTENARCFYNLEPGRYQVAQQVPADLQMTSAANVAVEASADVTVAVAFGSRVRGEPITEAPDDNQTQPTSGAMICVNAFHDENANAVLDANEGYMAGVTLTVASGSDVVGQVVSAGTEAAHCFDNLAPGTYQVSQQVPEPLEMTTAASAILAVSEGQAMKVEFGSRLQTGDTVPLPPDSGDEDQNADSGDEGPNLLAIGGLVAIILGVILLGALIFFLLRR
jgi:hypothetical protein